jgi:hypothetical protein
MWRAEQAWQDELRTTTIADIAELTMRQAPPAALAKGITWITQVITARTTTARN